MWWRPAERFSFSCGESKNLQGTCLMIMISVFNYMDHFVTCHTEVFFLNESHSLRYFFKINSSYCTAVIYQRGLSLQFLPSFAIISMPSMESSPAPLYCLNIVCFIMSVGCPNFLDLSVSHFNACW